MIAAPLSTVSLRAALPSGPPPAANTTASAPRTTSVISCDVGGLEVDHGRLDAVLLEVGDVLGLADHADRLVAGLGDEAAELAGDLSVATCDDDAHVSTVASQWRRPCARAR